MALKWDCETTIKFIQEYKRHECLWNFKSPNYKNKQMREVAYCLIVESMDLPGCGVHEVKNKIKNLRSTYSQEMKKIEDSMKSEHGPTYKSNIKWLSELEPVYRVGNKRNNLDNVFISNTRVSTPMSHPPATKKKIKDVMHAVNNFKSLQESKTHDSYEQERDAFDVFGKSVAMQLKRMSEERALLAQCKIQTILTEFGIEDLNEKRLTSTMASCTYTIPVLSTTVRDIQSRYSHCGPANAESILTTTIVETSPSEKPSTSSISVPCNSPHDTY